MQGYLMNVQWSDEDAGYIATCKEFPGLSAFGETESEATQQAYIALGGFIATCLEHEDTLPEPHQIKSVGIIARHTGSLKDMAIIVWNDGQTQPPVGTILYIKAQK